jgi:hypothetical protein
MTGIRREMKMSTMVTREITDKEGKGMIREIMEAEKEEIRVLMLRRTLIMIIRQRMISMKKNSIK